MLDQVLGAQFPILHRWALVSVAQSAASTLTVVLIFALGVHLNSEGSISVGGIVSFVGFALLILGRLEQLAHFVSDLSRQTQALQEMFAILDERQMPDELGESSEIQSVRGEVIFENVSFQYGSSDGGASRAALKDLSFRVQAGQTAAIVGATGAGKTTALALLYRAYDPNSGRILIDGRDIKQMSLRSLRSNISVVFQDTGLLFRSIAENVRVGNPEATDDEVKKATTVAQAHAFIARKPLGYATMVTERGRSLSGGERQRLAIARAILKDAPILILDEATSSLDHATEVDVQRALHALVRQRTTLIIAHRLSTIRHADVIFVMKDGELVEQGGYDELMECEGLFASLARSGQFSQHGEPTVSNEAVA
jgi:ATP-binding cassette subfamily B protein